MEAGENMTRRALPFGFLVTLAVIAYDSSARADGAVMIAGKISSRERDIIVNTLELTATSLTWKLTAPPFSREAIEASLTCLKGKAPWGCVGPGIRGNDQLVIVEVEGDHGPGTPMTVVTVHVLTAATEGQFFASRYCDLCNDDALKRATADLSKQLLREAAERTGRTKLTVHSKPDKAWILLDGKMVGATNSTRATYPGTHTVMLQHVGYKTAVREVAILDGQTLDVAFDMDPEPSSSAGSGSYGPSSDHPSQLLPYLTLGIGGTAILAGVALVVFSENPDPHGPQRPHYYDTTNHGIITFALGAIATSAGIYLLLSRNATSATTVTPLPGGGVAAGWTGRF